MQIGFVGLGRMGGNMVHRIHRDSDHTVVAFDPNPDAVSAAEGNGATGAGHFVKMVHNGVEYGMMQAYAEGFELMHKSKYPIELKDVATLWNRGSVVRSWLCELAERAFDQEGNDLSGLKGYVDDSGEGRWMMADAIDHAVPT